MAAMEAANVHYQNGHHQQPGPPLPASPTLTNPDMILPDYPDYDRSDLPDADLDRAEHSLMMWNNGHTSSSGPDMHHMFVATGLAGPRAYGPAGPVTPTTPIIYGNGTMLSDIGEVTEVESTVGKPSPVRVKSALRRAASPKRGSGGEGGPGPALTAESAGMIRKRAKQNMRAKRERRSSMESTSTITTEDPQAPIPADFDDSVSVGDSVFQGDDEESMASSYVEGTAAVEPMRLGVARVENIDRLSTYSTTSLSRRAEEILANAKKRLTTMEGNLTRARSTLHYTSPYGSEGSTPSPPFQRASTAMHLGDPGGDPAMSPREHTPGHTRMSSDLAMRNGLPYRVSMPRSQSALGAAGGYRQPLTASRSADHIRGDLEDESQRPVHRASSVRETGLKLLTEDEVARLGEADSASQNARLEAFLSPTFGSFHSDSGVRNPPRSSSAAQMRDIKDQMRDLKGKISSLREQARVDNLKRRSLQSLRTPSPFTHSQVDPWYAEPPSNRTSEIITSDFPGRNPWNGEESSVDGEAREDAPQLENGHEEEETDYTDAETGIRPEASNGFPDSELLSSSTPAPEVNGGEYDNSDMLTENGDTDEDQDFHDADDADYMSESGESLYHDSVQHQISHEDREDAFDYEHFFLHSAMGTMSLTRRASNESFTSEDSVETTRGPTTNGTNGTAFNPEQPPLLGRRNSSNSISTIDTFATAQEARSLKSPVSPDEGTFDTSSRATSAQSHRFRAGSAASKRLSLGPGTRDTEGDGAISPIAEEASSNSTPNSPAPAQQTARRASVIHRPMSTGPSSSSSGASLHHRPSIASFESVGTNRSFPLVPSSFPGTVGVKKANSTGVLTPRARDSPDAAHHHHHRQQHQHHHLLNGDGDGDSGAAMGAITSRLMRDMGKSQIHQTQTQTGHDHQNQNGETGPHPLDALLREDKYLVERLVEGLGRCVLGLTENGRASAESRMYRRRLDAARRVLEGFEVEVAPGTGAGQ